MRATRRRSLVVVLSDFRDPALARRPLAVFGRRHDLVAAIVEDPRERELVAAGGLRLADSDEPARRAVLGTRRARRDAYQRAAAEHRAAIARRLREESVELVWPTLLQPLPAGALLPRAARSAGRPDAHFAGARRAGVRGGGGSADAQTQAAVDRAAAAARRRRAIEVVVGHRPASRARWKPPLGTGTVVGRTLGSLADRARQLQRTRIRVRASRPALSNGRRCASRSKTRAARGRTRHGGAAVEIGRCCRASRARHLPVSGACHQTPRRRLGRRGGCSARRRSPDRITRRRRSRADAQRPPRPWVEALAALDTARAEDDWRRAGGIGARALRRYVARRFDLAAESLTREEFAGLAQPFGAGSRYPPPSHACATSTPNARAVSDARRRAGVRRRSTRRSASSGVGRAR
jgi:hypothetical protein